LLCLHEEHACFSLLPNDSSALSTGNEVLYASYSDAIRADVIKVFVRSDNGCLFFGADLESRRDSPDATLLPKDGCL
ncbi:hypothetical protein P5F04_16365, partial [Clostridium perfringens]|nr:hypothetical protein [Clostridium perfringens]